MEVFWQLLQEFGAVVGPLLLFIYWMMKRIDYLLDRNGRIYQEEIDRMHEVQKMLLRHVLGSEQPSSRESPTLRELEEGGSSMGGARDDQGELFDG